MSAPAASASLASGSVVSALVLNVAFWLTLVVSIPLYGFNAVYAGAALFGVVVLAIVAAVFTSILDGGQFVERPVRFVARHVGADADAVVESIRSFASRVEALMRQRWLLTRLGVWALANWVLDACSLWLFLRAFDVSINPVALFVAFSVANILAAIPISPGGVGIVEWAYITLFVSFGVGIEAATIAVTTYRVAQFLFPIVLGGIASASFGIEAGRARHRRTATRS